MFPALVPTSGVKHKSHDNMASFLVYINFLQVYNY